jgi:hypothetical protein
MSLSVSIAAFVVASTNFISPEPAHFPGRYFDTEARHTLQRRAMERWPGPAQLVEIWRTGELERREKMAILLGASVSHDPVLLPIYRDAIDSDHPRMRMAAAYGYRELLGDARPDLSSGVDDEAARRLATEMDLMAATLRTKPLVEIWLHAVLMTEGGSMPGWRGIGLHRNLSICLGALEEIVVFEDFSRVATAYRLAQSTNIRLSLLRLLEAVSLRYFHPKPDSGRTPWGSQGVRDALAAGDAFVAEWFDHRCSTDAEEVLVASLAAMGARGIDPLGPDSWDLWVEVLRRGKTPWRVMAARQLYQLGGRWSFLSIFRDESPQQIEVLEELLRWYDPTRSDVSRKRRPSPSP